MSALQLQSITQTANVQSYNGVTKVITLDKPVNISLGTSGQYGSLQSTFRLSGTYTNISGAIQGGGLAQLSTDENGNFVGIFNVPAGVFQVGKRVLRIDNRTVQSDPTTATTFAEATFQAGGLLTNIGLATGQASIDSSATTFTQVANQSAQVINPNGSSSPYDPVAQTFTISKSNYPNGVFLASVKLFFASKPSSNEPITVSIVPTINGYPSGQSLAHSTVTLSPSSVNVKSSPYITDPSSYTNFVFDAPVYVQSGVPYAIMIYSNSSDYQLYFAQQGQIISGNLLSTTKASIDSATPTVGTKIGAAPYVGGFFESQNAQTWTADLTKSLMFSVDQCVFDTSAQGTVQFTVPQNLPYRKMGTKDVLHKISANSVSNLYGNFSPSLVMDAFNLATTDFTPTGTGINYSYTSTLLNGFLPTTPASVNPGTYGTPMPEHIFLNDGQGERVLLKQSNSSFVLSATLTSNDPNVSPVIADDGVSLYNIRYFINNMGIGNNVISVVNGGTGYNMNTATVTITSGLNGSTTVSDTGGPIPTFQIIANTTGTILGVVTTNPGSGYLVTPTITISDPSTRSGNANAVISIAGETSPKGGNAFAKYFTKKVVLAPGTSAGDLRVYYTAYRPIGTQVYVYYRILSSQDTTPFESQNWQLMTTVSNQSSYSTNRSDLIEFECAPGIFTSNQANNNISYVSSSGQKFNSFTQFAIKVVLATPDNTNVPFLTDIRALALPSGTGL